MLWSHSTVNFSIFHEYFYSQLRLTCIQLITIIIVHLFYMTSLYDATFSFGQYTQRHGSTFYHYQLPSITHTLLKGVTVDSERCLERESNPRPCAPCPTDIPLSHTVLATSIILHLTVCISAKRMSNTPGTNKHNSSVSKFIQPSSNRGATRQPFSGASSTSSNDAIKHHRIVDCDGKILNCVNIVCINVLAFC